MICAVSADADWSTTWASAGRHHVEQPHPHVVNEAMHGHGDLAGVGVPGARQLRTERLGHVHVECRQFSIEVIETSSEQGLVGEAGTGSCIVIPIRAEMS